MEYEIECNACGWSGNYDELVCTDEDFNNQEKPVSECKFNICPECGAVDQFEEIENDFR